MLITGLVLTPTILADAAADLTGLKTIVNAAANTIGEPTNSSRNWGEGSGVGIMGTANVVENITQTVLNAKYNLDTDKMAWVNQTAIDPSPPPSPHIITITDLYTDYVNTVPNLSTALTAAGRAWHWEMNAPVYAAIAGLQQCLTQFQTSLLEADVIDKVAVLRTIRASSSLEDAQVAWSKILNLPGTAKGSSSNDAQKRAEHKTWPVQVKGGVFTHEELWGRERSAVERAEAPVAVDRLERSFTA
ncbi:hypothetical protein K504DRAFT_475475 [Pleomassaria siparia CBS 279.74]|uniref:Uncharacterized protein n=1 Tax=Pleomassaria siparia CBS 279.74 TaxID=1314801 RepID=A0A6G1KGN0_9PLEO|nr:hypothetical protein K504DRAFT_475475 [Pleomassaria siparia CBS 279.74]